MKTPVNPSKRRFPRACFSRCRRARPSASPRAPSRAQRDRDQGCEHCVPHVAGSSAVPGQGLGAGAAEGMPEIILNVAGDVFQTPHGFSEVMELKRRNLPLQKLLWGGFSETKPGDQPRGACVGGRAEPTAGAAAARGAQREQGTRPAPAGSTSGGGHGGRMLWLVSAGRPDKHGVRDGLGRLRN